MVSSISGIYIYRDISKDFCSEAMERGNRVLLAANFYGCYLDPELFDDHVIIPDAGIRE